MKGFPFLGLWIPGRLNRGFLSVPIPPTLSPFCPSQDKEIYRWPIKESLKAMIAWEWTIEKAREGEEEKTEKKKTRKISQTAQVMS
jgi:hypothetical protein